MNNANPAGDSGRITREYFDSLLVELRHVDGQRPSTALELYGHTFATPVMTAALSHLNGVHPQGMVELARGAAMAEAVLWTGMGDEAELDAIAQTGAKFVKIIKPYEDNDLIFRKIKHAEARGALAVGMDIDHAFNHRGEYDQVHGQPMRPKSRDELSGFVRATSLPFVMKGVLSVQDAVKCLEAGAGGIVVSHHHGILDYAVPPLMVLPAIVRAIGGKIPVFVDCGVQSGMDAFKALALGATAVSVGRSLLDPLKELGAPGVRDAIAGMTASLAHAMSMTGSAHIRSIDPAVIRIP